MKKESEDRFLGVALESKRPRSSDSTKYLRWNGRGWVLCKKPKRGKRMSEVTRGQNLSLGEASRRATVELVEGTETRTYWEERYRPARREWTRHGKKVLTLRQFVIGELMKSRLEGNVSTLKT